MLTHADVLLALPYEAATELRVHNMVRALDTYLGLGFHATSVGDGWAVLHSDERVIVLRAAS